MTELNIFVDTSVNRCTDLEIDFPQKCENLPPKQRHTIQIPQFCLTEYHDLMLFLLELSSIKLLFKTRAIALKISMRVGTNGF